MPGFPWNQGTKLKQLPWSLAFIDVDLNGPACVQYVAGSLVPGIQVESTTLGSSKHWYHLNKALRALRLDGFHRNLDSRLLLFPTWQGSKKP